MSVSFIRGENPLSADKLNTAFGERVLRSGDAMQGLLTLAGDPVSAFDAATKQYVDARSALMGPPGPTGSALDFASPPPMGSTTPNTGAFTTLGSSGLGSFGTASAAWITATGGAQATLGTGGTGNPTLNLRSGGTGLVQLGGSAFSAVQIIPAATNGGILQITQPTTASNLIGIATSNTTTGGLNLTSPVVFTRNWTYAGASTDTILNRPFQANSTIGGVSTSTTGNGYGINQFNITYTGFQTVGGARGVQILSHVGAGSIMQSAVGLSVRQDQTGPATIVDMAWQANHVYAIGNICVNGISTYRVTTGGTSAASGGPTGFGTSIVDGTVVWADAAPTFYAQMGIGLDITQSSNKNLGGTATGAVGAQWAAVIGTTLNAPATYYAESNVVELDDNIQATVRNAFTLGLIKRGGQATTTDYGLTLVGENGNSWKNPIVLRNAADPNGVAIQARDPASNALQTMAGFIDALMVEATGSNTQATWSGLTGGGGYILRGPNAQLRGNGDLQLGNAGFVIGANSLTIDTTYRLLTAVGALSGGTNWTTNDQAVDDFGNVGVVTAVAGVPTAINIVGQRKTYVATASVPGGAVTWHQMHAGQVRDSTYGFLPCTPFTSANETYSAGTTLNFGTGAATIMNFGRSGGALGFYGATAVAKQTGVAVTVAAIHTALTNLGLIAP